MLILELLAVAVVSGYIGHRFNAGTITAIEADLAKVGTSASADAKSLVAAIKSHL